MALARTGESVCELQGLYGPYQVSELVLQRIWLKGAFDSDRLRDNRGREVEVVFPGAWNRLAGPDFLGAELRFDGEAVVGDVEIHFSQGDWRTHGHDANPDFDKVVLHVLYHPPSGPAQPSDIPSVSLLDLLWHDLEEYASEDSILETTGTESERGFDSLLPLDLESRLEVLAEAARKRWRLKVDFARLRLGKLGWETACHQTALEILGYRANRIPMLQVATRFPLERIRSERPSLESLLEAGDGRWSTRGVRPANFPKLRLEQYLAWTASIPDWPDRLGQIRKTLPVQKSPLAEVAAFRRVVGLKSWRERIAVQVMASRLSGSRLDTMVCDGFLPLLSAEASADHFSLWSAWFAGDAPTPLVDGLKRLQAVNPARAPLCNGLIQGLIQLCSAPTAEQVPEPSGVDRKTN